MTNKSKEINYQKSLMQIIVCLFMGGHEISIKSIFDFRTSLPINEILYIQYINTTDKLFISGEILSATTQICWVFISFVQKIAI
jgi:hypothetical protein